MNSSANRKRIGKAIGVLAIGAVLTAGGLFLWQNQFDISLFSSASSNRVQAIIVVGEKPTETQPEHARQVVSLVTLKQPKAPELIDKSETSTVTSSLRDQSVLGYNDVTKPISDHVYILARTGRNILLKGITNKDSVTAIGTRTTKELTALLDLLAARPGVFPSGYTVFISTLPDPTNQSGDVQHCAGKLPNNGAEYTRGAFDAVNSAIRNIKVQYPQHVFIVDSARAFVGHGVYTENPWFSDCLTINEKGEAEIAKLFVAEVEKQK